MLSMCWLYVVYVLSICCPFVVYLLSMCCLCVIYVLSICCLCVVYVSKSCDLFLSDTFSKNISFLGIKQYTPKENVLKQFHDDTTCFSKITAKYENIRFVKRFLFDNAVDKNEKILQGMSSK